MVNDLSETEEEFQSKAQRYQKQVEAIDNRSDLVNLWQQIKRKATPNWGSGQAFEYLVVRAFQFEGLQVSWPYRVTLPQKFGTVEQIDGVIYHESRAFLIESKHYEQALGIESVAKLRLRLERRPPGTMGIVFSVSNFTLPTEIFTQFVSPLNVILWGPKDFEYAIINGKMVEGLAYKLRFAVESGLPLVRLGVDE